jgi:hypothetical protein
MFYEMITSPTRETVMQEPMDASANVALESCEESSLYTKVLKSDFDRIFTEDLGLFCARGVSDIPQVGYTE